MHSPRIATNPQANRETKTATDTPGCEGNGRGQSPGAGEAEAQRYMHMDSGRHASTRRGSVTLSLSSFSLAIGTAHHTALFPLALRGLPCHWAQPINHSQTPAEASVFCSGQWEKYSSLFLPPRSSAGWLKSLSLKPNTTNPWGGRKCQREGKEQALRWVPAPASPPGAPGARTKEASRHPGGPPSFFPGLASQHLEAGAGKDAAGNNSYLWATPHANGLTRTEQRSHTGALQLEATN